MKNTVTLGFERQPENESKFPKHSLHIKNQPSINMKKTLNFSTFFLTMNILALFHKNGNPEHPYIVTILMVTINILTSADRS